MSSGNYGSRDLPQPFSSRQLAPGTSILHRRALQLLEQDELVPYTFEALFISNGEIFTLQSEYERIGFDAYINRLALKLYRVLTLHVHSLDGHYRRSLQLRLMNLRHRFRHDFARGVPVITVLDNYIHVRDRLYLGQSYVDYLFDKQGKLLANWTDDTNIAVWVDDNSLIPTIYREGDDHRWTVGSQVPTFVSEWIVHSPQRMDSDRGSIFYYVHSIKSTRLDKLASWSTRGSTNQQPDLPSELDFTRLGTEIQNVINGPAPQLFSDREGAWMKDDDNELRFLKVSEDEKRFEDFVTSGLQQALTVACRSKPMFADSSKAVWWNVLYGGRSDAILQLVPYPSGSDPNTLSRSELFRLLEVSDSQGLFAIVKLGEKCIHLDEVYLANEILREHGPDLFDDDQDPPRKLSWNDLLHHGFEAGKMISEAELGTSTRVFITDFERELISDFELLVPSSLSEGFEEGHQL